MPMQACWILMQASLLLLLRVEGPVVGLLLLPPARAAVHVWLLPLPSSHPAQPSAAVRHTQRMETSRFVQWL
jgi:hypothetical protein